MYNLNYLNTFNVLAEELSFSKTGLRLGIAQSAVSRQIKELESQLSTDLFLRDNKKVHLTSNGKHLHEKTKGFQSTVADCIYKFKNQENLLEGCVRLICPRELGEYLFESVVSDIAKHYPNLQLDIYFGSTAQAEKSILNSDLDMAITLNTSDHENLKCYELKKQSSYFITHKKSKNYKNLKALKYIAYKKGDRLLYGYLKSKIRKLSTNQIDIAYYMNSHKNMIDLISKVPDLYAVLPELSLPLERAIKNKKIEIIEEIPNKTPLYLMCANAKYESKTLKVLRQMILQNFKSLNIKT